MKIKRIAASIIGGLLFLVGCIGFPAFAETSLPSGAVKGLPERLAALDDTGNPVNSETGEYFFHVENMKFGETYSKNVQLMNLCEDQSYDIFFYVQPLFKSGEIDLEKGCECVFYLDGSEFYRGDVNGKGNIDLTTQHYHCGYYAPGTSHTLRCEVTWKDIDVLGNVDYGWRLVDKDGEHVLVGPDGESYAEGEIEFKWIFYAMVSNDHGDSSSQDDNGGTTLDSGSDSQGSGSWNNGGNTGTDQGFFPPYTGFLMKDGRFWLISMGVITLMILVLLVMIKKQKRAKNK